MIMETLYSQLFPTVKEKKDTKWELDDLVLNRRLAKAKNKEKLDRLAKKKDNLPE